MIPSLPPTEPGLTTPTPAPTETGPSLTLSGTSAQALSDKVVPGQEFSANVKFRVEAIQPDGSIDLAVSDLQPMDLGAPAEQSAEESIDTFLAGQE